MILPQDGASATPTRVVVVPTLMHLRPNEALNLTADARCLHARVGGRSPRGNVDRNPTGNYEAALVASRSKRGSVDRNRQGEISMCPASHLAVPLNAVVDFRIVCITINT
jgi:hypothetical protein